MSMLLTLNTQSDAHTLFAGVFTAHITALGSSSYQRVVLCAPPYKYHYDPCSSFINTSESLAVPVLQESKSDPAWLSLHDQDPSSIEPNSIDLELSTILKCIDRSNRTRHSLIMEKWSTQKRLYSTVTSCDQTMARTKRRTGRVDNGFCSYLSQASLPLHWA
jgi:hypothetical protein